MTQDKNRAEQVRSSATGLLQRYFSQDTPTLAVANATSNTEQLTFGKRWKLVTRADHETLTGAYSGNNYSSHSACRQAVTRTQEAISGGEVSHYVRALEQFVAGDLARATWGGTDRFRHTS